MRTPRTRVAQSATARSAVAPGERLQKRLAQAGLASRRGVETWIREGRLTVNGLPAMIGQRVVNGDEIRLDGRPLRAPRATESAVWLCHRSPGDELLGAGSSWTERLPHRGTRRLIAVSPMPRNDGGLEIVCSDGALATQLQRCIRGLEIEFSVRIRGELTSEHLERLLLGELDGGRRVAVAKATAGGGEGSNRWCTLVTTGASGKDIRQLVERLGANVSRILRVRVGEIMLTRDLGRGKFRELDAREQKALLSRNVAPDEAAALPDLEDQGDQSN